MMCLVLDSLVCVYGKCLPENWLKRKNPNNTEYPKFFFLLVLLVSYLYKVFL